MRLGLTVEPVHARPHQARGPSGYAPEDVAARPRRRRGLGLLVVAVHLRRRAQRLGAGFVPVPADAPSTFCDALQTPRVSPITFGILRERASAALSVSDDEAAEAVRFAWDRHGLVVEPGGAVGLAALLSGKLAAMDETVVVLSGGNVDPALHARIIAEAA